MPSNTAGAAGSDAPELDGASGAGTAPDLGPNGGATTEPAGRAGSPSEVAPSAGAQGYESLIESGTRTCVNEKYCFALACYAPLGFEPYVCLARCESDADCHPSETCVRSAGLEPTCYSRCNSPIDCYGGFDCIDFSGAGQDICFPARWAQRLKELD
ncbi:MAG TPA: hypothetical protein VGC79_12055 [Polyangiaceae bacterium]